MKSRPLRLHSFAQLLQGLPSIELPAILADVPAEWKNDSVSKQGGLSMIELHLRAVAARTADFVEQVERRLA